MKRYISMFALSICLLFTLSLPAFGQTDWEKFEGNPVFTKGEIGTWDEDLTELPAVIHDGNEYLMYYQGRNSSDGRPHIGLATSPDGINWARFSGNPILPQVAGQWDGREHANPTVVFDGFLYKMWYMGVSSFGGPADIGLAVSTDGRNWTKYSGNPVLTHGGSGEWDAFRTQLGNVYFDGSQYNMWYWGIDNSLIRRIGNASSPDGITWTKSSSNPILNLGTSGEWDDRFVFDPDVIWNGSFFEMWYSGQSSSKILGIGYATSPDGIIWTKHGQILDPGDWQPSVIKEGSIYKMWYASASPLCCIHYATSPPTIHIDIDIKPQSCPNPLNPKSKGLLPVAILGRVDFNVSEVDISTIKLEGISPIRSGIEDEATPFEGEICDCTEEGPDGHPDLTLKFDVQEIVEALGEIEGGDEIVLTLTGELTDGTPIEGQDCVIIVGEKKGGEPLITFERTYGGSAADEGYAVEQTSDGGYIIAGQSSSFSAGGLDVYLIKTDSLGDTLWTRTYGGTLDEGGFSVHQTLDEGYFIVGYTRSFGAGSNDVYMIKTDSLGDTLWTRTYGGPNLDEGFSFLQTSDGGFIIAGNTGGPVFDDVYLIRINSMGDTIWTKTYGGGSQDQGYTIHQTSDGGFIITGWTRSFGAGGEDIYLIRIDSLGDTLWTKTYGGTNDERGLSVQQTSDGGFIITGWTLSFGAGGDDVYLVKTNSSGDTLWTRTYGGTSDERGWSVLQTQDGGYIITGRTTSFGTGSNDVFLIKTNSLGDTLWTKTFGGHENDYGYSVQQTLDEGYIIAGFTESFGSGGTDAYLIKTDENGKVDDNSGGGPQSGSNRALNPTTFNLYQNQPNPSSTSTLIQYALPADAKVSLKIYDISGKFVETLVDKRQKSGFYQVEWEGKNQPSGIYFYRLQTGDFTSTKKMILNH